MAYAPSQEILERYADVLVNFALGGGEGIKKGDVVRLVVDEAARPLYVALYAAILKSGGHVLSSYGPSADKLFKPGRTLYELASDEQVEFFPEKFYRGLVDEMDHMLAIDSDTDPHELKGIDSSRVMARGKALKPFREWRVEKENRGEFTWTLANYGTEAMAKEAGMSLEEYWEQIIQACFLDDENPIARWQETYDELYAIRDRLNALNIEWVRIVGPDVDLRVRIGEHRVFMGGSGRNMPSFELFTSPDWRGTEGWINFDQPLYRYGNLIKGIELAFMNGKVIDFTAKENEDVLAAMIATENADKVGEWSLTDKRFSRITRFMADTLYDENTAGQHGHGNTHIALGAAYRDCYDGDPSALSDEQWEELGYNDSSVHTDIISTTARVVVATLFDGRERIIYEDGQFTV